MGNGSSLGNIQAYGNVMVRVCGVEAARSRVARARPEDLGPKA